MSSLRSFFSLFLILQLIAFSLFAVEGESTLAVFNHPLTVAELVDIALKNNPSTKKAWWNARASLAAVGCAQGEYYPHLGVEGDVSHEKVRKFVNGPDTECTTYGAALVLDMMLYDCGKTNATVESAKKGLQAASWDAEMSIQKVLVSVLENAYKMLHAQEVYEASLLSLKEAEKTCQAAVELNHVGLKPVFDVYSSKRGLSLSKMDVCAKKADLLMCEAKLIVSLGLQPGFSLKLQPIDSKESPKREQLDQLITYASTHRADLLSKQAAYEASLFDVEKEENAAWPTLSLFGRGGLSRASHDTNHTGKSSPGAINHSLHEVSKSGQYTVGVKVELPLFTGFEEMYKKQEALAMASLTKEEVFQLQLSISQDIATAKCALEAAQEMLPCAQENLDNAMKAYECSFERYMAGEGKWIELSDAQQHIASARVQYSDIKTQFVTAIANLAYATGTLK